MTHHRMPRTRTPAYVEKPLNLAGKTIAQIIAEVAAKHDLTMIEMLSQRRPRALAHARQEAYWRCMSETLASLPMIGRCFGNRDHTTILKGGQAHVARVKAAAAAAAAAQPPQHAAVTPHHESAADGPA
jgi:chromosomal replication initiation ATPase DnaA